MAAKTKYVGYGTAIVTVTALILWMALSPDFEVEVSDDISCLGTPEYPCISYINVTFKPQNPIYRYFYIYSKDKVKLGFSPEIRRYALCKRDKRYKIPRSYDNLCGPGYREILTKPYYYKYKYYYKFYKGKKEEWMLVGLKMNPADTIKWGMKVVNGEVDPVWKGMDGEVTLHLLNPTKDTVVLTNHTVDGKLLQNITWFTNETYCAKWIDKIVNGSVLVKDCAADGLSTKLVKHDDITVIQK